MPPSSTMPSKMPPFGLDGFDTWRPVLRRAQDVSRYVHCVMDGFDTGFAQVPYRIKQRIGGAVFEIASDVDGLLAIAQTALAGVPTDQAADARLLIVSQGNVEGIPPVPIWESHGYNDHRMCQKFEPTPLRLYHYRERDFWQFFDRQTGRGVQLMATPDSVPDWDSGSPLRNLLRWHLTNDQQGFVHAGTLGKAGQGVMLAGPGGSGKSGTVLAGILAGMQSVGDDYVLARLDQEGGVSVAPVFKTLKSDPDGMARLGVKTESGASVGALNWQGKYQFTFQDLVQRDPSQHLKIHALCVPVVAHADHTTITPMGRREAFLALAQTGFRQMPGDTRHSLAFCTEVIKRLPTYRMSLGTDPDEIIDTLHGFLATQADVSKGACA